MKPGRLIVNYDFGVIFEKCPGSDGAVVVVVVAAAAAAWYHLRG